MKIQELESFFESADLPNGMVIGKHMRITNVKKCVESHLCCLKSNPGNKIFMPYYDRLIEIRNKILSL